MKDQFGNEMAVEVKQEGNRIIKTIIYTLEEGKSTLRGQFKKLNNDDGCAFPNRLSCNGEVGCSRCKFMKCISVGNWQCTFKK